MKQTKVYQHELAQNGFKELNPDEMRDCQLAKRHFVSVDISLAVFHADCGWMGTEYVAYTNGEEYVFFLYGKRERGRGICVTGNSKTAIATAVFDNID